MESKTQNSGAAAVVLAAGMSRRMSKEPKQLLPLGGKPLLQHTLDNVRRSRVDEMVLVLGFAADSVMQQIKTEGIRVVMNQEYEQGMGTSLRAGIAALGPSVKAAFAVLADQPFIRPETLDRMIAYHNESGAYLYIEVSGAIPCCWTARFSPR